MKLDARALQASITVGGNELMALSVATSERLFEIARAEVAAAIDEEADAASDPSGLIGADAVVKLFDASGDERAFAGIVTHASVTRSGGDATELRVRVEPRLARLRQRADTRRFSELAVLDVTKKVLEGAGYSADEIDDQVGDAPAVRATFVQYRETDWAFLRRILAESGILIFVVTRDDVDVVVLTDKDLGPISPAELNALEGDGLASADEGVFRLKHERRIVPGRATSLTHDFERPKLDPTKLTETGSDAEKGLEVFQYPVRSVVEGDVERAARVRAESLASRRYLIRGESSSLRLLPGYRFTIKGHLYEPMNVELLVIAAGLSWARSGDGVQVRASFEGFPIGDTPYRPEVGEARAPARGVMAAKVTGPAGKEIDPDAHGRVTVLPQWDRVSSADEKSSPKLRATQLPLGESMLTPRIGWEVLVGHWDGDADDPLVVGRMINGAAPPTYALPGGKAKLSIQTPTTPGGGSTNELRFDDSRGSEEMFFNASKDMTTKVGNNATTNTTANETRDVGADRTFSVLSSYEEAIDGARAITVGGNQTVGVTSYLVDDIASHAHTVGGSRNITIGGDHKTTSTAACTVDVGGTCIELVAGTVSVENAATFKDDIGAVRVDLTASTRAVDVSGAYSESIGAAKVILSAANVATEAASLKKKIAGACLIKTKADHAESAKGDFTEVAGGAQIVKATNVTFEAQSLLTVIMGASTITLTPGSVVIAGVKITVNATTDELGGIMDN